MPITKADLLGTWSLVRTFETIDGAETGGTLSGEGATGVIQYMPDDRVAVQIAYGGRPLMSGGRYDTNDAETARSARTYTAYAGTFEVSEGEDIVVHHLDLSLYENDKGTDYVRHVLLAGDRLTLSMPAQQTDKGLYQGSLEWQRMSSFA